MQVGVETPGDVGARGVAPREFVVGAAGAVERAAGRDVVDVAGEGEIDGFVGVGAVVGGELGVGEGDGAGLDSERTSQCLEVSFWNGYW